MFMGYLRDQFLGAGGHYREMYGKVFANKIITRVAGGGCAAVALAAAAGAETGVLPSGLIPNSWNPWAPHAATAQAPRERNVPVDVAVAVKKRVPVRVDLLGTVTPIASVAVKTRVDTEILGVHFQDGAMV